MGWRGCRGETFPSCLVRYVGDGSGLHAGDHRVQVFLDDGAGFLHRDGRASLLLVVTLVY
jgi:hypothetical protein